MRPYKKIGYGPSAGGLAGLLSRPCGGELFNVSRSRRFLVALVASIWLAGPMIPRGSLAATAVVVEKCEGQANKAYPLSVPGNPAAGRAHGTERQFLDYFNKCVKHGAVLERAKPTKPQKKRGDKS